MSKMDYFALINQAKAEKAALVDQADQMVKDKKFGTDLEAIQNKIKDKAQEIDQLTNQAAISAAGAEPVQEPDDGGKDPKNEKKPFRVFNSLGEQLQAIRNAASGHVDERLTRVNNAVNGMNTGTGMDGGYAIQEDFARGVLETAAQTGEILSRVNTYTVGANSNSVKWYNIDETDVSAHVFGGVQMYWAEEGGTVAASKPKLKQVKCDLEKMMGIAYATSEMLEDAAFMSSFFGRAFAVATERLLEDAIFNGSGTGQPKGILNSEALITASRASAGKITTPDILAMWRNAHAKYRRNMVWVAHPDCEEQLQQLTMGDKPIWMPEGGLSDSPYQRVLGRPVIYTDNCAALGSKGDLQLDDLSKYTLLKKGTARQDWSMHVEFLTDQMAFRVILRVSGTPELTQAVKIKNSETKRSAFIALGGA